MRHIVMFSGGAVSWCCAQRVVSRFPGEPVTLLFADTLIEDEDTYRFLMDGARALGLEVTRVADGRNPWQLFGDEGFIGNSRVDICSRVLKRDLLRKWLVDNTDPAETVVYLGFSWDEAHRFEKSRHRWHPWKVEAPMLDPPFIDTRRQVISAGVRLPRLYELGFHHNNCGGFCVKAGMAQFALLHRVMPERYAWHEQQENAWRASAGLNHSILTDRRGGKRQPLTLEDFRYRLEQQHSFDGTDWGACSCIE